MGYTMRIEGKTKNRPSFISFVETDVVCPNCDHVHPESWWYPQYDKSGEVVIYKKCQGCRKLLGITTDMRGDVKAWMKMEEK